MLTVDIENAKNLKLPLSRIAAAVNRNTPIETCVLVDADSEGLTLTAVDSRTHQLTLRVPEANTATPGLAILNADLFNRMVGTLVEEPLQLGINEIDNQLVIQCDTRIELDLFTSPADDFPVVSELPITVATVDAERLSEAIKKALMLSEKDEFITLVGKGDALFIYTRTKGRLFSRTTLQVFGNTKDWAISLPQHLLAKLPASITGTAELKLSDDEDVFAIAVGTEHLLIRQLAQDTISTLIDSMVNKQTQDYWVVKSEPLKLDLKRAGLIKDKKGLKLVRDKAKLRATCGAGGKGNVNTGHDLVQAHGSLKDMFVDPVMLAKAVGALEAVDLVGEQLMDTIPSYSEDEEDTVILNLRLTDHEAQDHRAVIVTTIQA